MTNDRYIMSFTTGGLFHREFVMMAMLYLELKDWNAVRDKALLDNLLQARTLNTSKRICRELILRLTTLSPPELSFLVKASHKEQGYLLWVAICRRYRFIADFAVEVLRERYLTLKTYLSNQDFDSFFNRKSEWHAELDEIKPSTRLKLRQVLFRMLREADLLAANGAIQTVMLSQEFLDALSRDAHSTIFYFPMFESELKRMTL